MNQEYVTRDGKAIITLLARDKDRNLKVFQIPDYPPHFWAKAPDGLLKDTFDRPIKLIETNHPGDVRKKRKAYEYHDEADILFPWRYLIDKGIYCGFENKDNELIPAEPLGIQPFINLFDLEVETPPEIMARPKNPKWPIVSFQFANTYNEQLELMMLNTKLTGEKVNPPEYAKHCVSAITRPVTFELRKKQEVQKIVVNPSVYLYDDERLMIQDSVTRADFFKFDSYSGYNSNLFDIPYWIRRGNTLGVNMRPLSPFRVVECRERVEYDKRSNTKKVRMDPRIKGVQLFDLYDAYQKWSGGRQGAKLVIPGKDFAQTYDFHLVMERECGFYYVDLGDKVADSKQNHPVAWLEYCTGDAYALWLLEKEKGIIKQFNRLRSLVGVPLEWSLYNSRLIDMRLLRLRERPLPSKVHREKSRVTGAIVLLPTPGVKEYVVGVDAKSQYSMLIRVYNLSPEMLDPKGEIKVGPMEDGTILRFKKSPEGIFPKAVKFDMDERDKYRAALKKMGEKDLRYDDTKVLETLHKFLVASYYGVTGYENFRLYDDNVRKAITFLGRETVLMCKKDLEASGYHVEYGDSVARDSPVIVMRANKIHVLPVEYTQVGDLVWSRTGFTRVNEVLQKSCRKRMFEVWTNDGRVICTEDHSLFENGQKKKPKELQKSVDVQDLPKLPEVSQVDENEAWLIGLYLAEGSRLNCAYVINNQNVELLKRCQQITGTSNEIKNYMESSNCYRLNIPSKLVEDCYCGDYKIVPSRILMGTHKTKDAFFKGFYAGDGDTSDMRIDQKSPVLAVSLMMIAESLGWLVSVRPASPKKHCWGLRFVKARRKKPGTIRFVRPNNYCDDVWDLSTDNGTFAIGRILAHNTDSIWVRLSGKFPAEGRIVEGIVNKTLRRIAWSHGAYLTLEAKYEQFCRRIIFVPKLQKRKGQIIAAKKRYAYVDEKGDLYVIGLAPRRSSTPIIDRRNVLEWLTLVMIKNDIQGAITLVRTLYQTLPTYPLNVIGLPKGLHKEEYFSRNPWKVGVDFMRRNYGKTFREDKKPLLIYLDVPKPKKRIDKNQSQFGKERLSYAVCITEQDATLPKELQERIDWPKMREKVITAYYKPLFQAIGISWDKVISTASQETLARWSA